MKKISIYLLLFISVFMFNACDEDLADLNINPDRSPTANPEEVLTSAIGYLGWMVDGEYNRKSMLWSQYWCWGPGVAIGNIARYDPDGADYNNVWIRAYANALADLEFIINSDSRAHSGVANILKAYIFQGLVDHFGNIPFTNALNGQLDNGSDFAPTFDDDAAVYAALIPIIDEGLAELEGASSGDIGGEDLIHNGDLDAWTRFGNSLKLRILMRQSGVNDVAAQVSTLIANGSFIEGGAHMAAIPFAGNIGDENPMFARMESGVNNFYVASNTMVNFLLESNDPRLEALYAPAVNTGTIVSIAQGSIDEEPFTASVDDYSQMTPALYDAANSVILMSDWEVWFLRAEAANKFATADDQNVAFTNAVNAHFNYLGTEGADNLLYTMNFAAASNKLELIAEQKWISMNGLQDDEGWIESRRFNHIQTIFETPVVSALSPNVYPSIWLYPANELALNPNAPVQRTVTEKVFWDN